VLDRRAFLAGMAGVVVAPLVAKAQSRTIPRLGYLTLTGGSPPEAAFRTRLRELGYFDHQNIVIEYRSGGGNVERLAEHAAELVQLHVDVLVAANTQAIAAARRATTTVPIVFPLTFDPVRAGYVASLARPGGNLTGLTPLNPVLTAKRVELLKEVIPSLSLVAVLRNPTNPGSVFVLDETEAAVAAAVRARAGALMVISDNMFFAQHRRIVELATRHGLPTIFDTTNFVEAGGLMSYGADLTDLFRRAADYVDKVLKGAKPAELPVEQARKFELVINLKTAKALGLTIPPSLLLRADQVIHP